MTVYPNHAGGQRAVVHEEVLSSAASVSAPIILAWQPHNRKLETAVATSEDQQVDFSRPELIGPARPCPSQVRRNESSTGITHPSTNHKRCGTVRRSQSLGCIPAEKGCLRLSVSASQNTTCGRTGFHQQMSDYCITSTPSRTSSTRPCDFAFQNIVSTPSAIISPRSIDSKTSSCLRCVSNYTLPTDRELLGFPTHPLITNPLGLSCIFQGTYRRCELFP